MFETTVGQLLINQALPSDMRNYQRKLDKNGTKAMFRELAEKHPEQYRDVAKQLMDVGRNTAFETGGQSFGLRHLLPPPMVMESRARLNARMRQILQDPTLEDADKETAIMSAATEEHKFLTKNLVGEAYKMGNPLADQVVSGARGNPAQLKRLIAGDMLYTDHRDNVIPFPVQRSYAEGLSPAEYWGATFGARRGLAQTKLATADAGFFGKQLVQLAHRLVVTATDDDREPAEGTAAVGMPTEVTDADNDGALLASPAGGYARNTLLTSKIRQDLANQGIHRILVRSPIVGGPAQGGVYARDVGYRERGRLPDMGDMVGLSAAQSVSERIAQGSLGSKHVGGVKGETKTVSGFPLLNQLVQIPKAFKGGASHAQQDGTVGTISPAPAGGYYVQIGDTRHFVAPGLTPAVKPGDRVEAGDVLSDGVPNPAAIVQHKGIGEGRRYFTRLFLDSAREAGADTNRRNIELLARGLIDHVELTEETDDNIPGDVVPYGQLSRTWKPRAGARPSSPQQAIGKYLEQPALHYSIGTRIQPSMLQDFEDFGVKDVLVHDESPPFKPIMVRAMANLQHDPDWLTQFLGSNQKRNLLHATHRGATSDLQGTSFVPALVEGTSFGKQWPKITLKPPAAP